MRHVARFAWAIVRFTVVDPLLMLLAVAGWLILTPIVLTLDLWRKTK